MQETELIHEELSYKIIGVLFEVYNKLGCNLQEKYYQEALKILFNQKSIPYLEQVRTDIVFNGEIVGRYYIDFIIDHKIVLEIKAKSNFSRSDIHQVLAYLRKSSLEVGLLANFTKDGVKLKRILKGSNPRRSATSDYQRQNLSVHPRKEVNP